MHRDCQAYTCAFARPRLPYTAEKGTGTAKRGVCHGNAMGMPCIIIELRGIALQVLENARVTAMQVLWELIVPEWWGYAIP